SAYPPPDEDFPSEGGHGLEDVRDQLDQLLARQLLIYRRLGAGDRVGQFNERSPADSAEMVPDQIQRDATQQGRRILYAVVRLRFEDQQPEIGFLDNVLAERRVVDLPSHIFKQANALRAQMGGTRNHRRGAYAFDVTWGFRS
ncbi:hypothetical protein QU38_01260, partial [Staphylococcus aureus]